MTWTPTEDDCREFAQKVRWLTGRTITQNDAGIELARLREKYDPDGGRIVSKENGPVYFGIAYDNASLDPRAS